MQVQENITLRPFNTFGMDSKARYFAAFSSVDDLRLLFGPRQTANPEMPDVNFKRPDVRKDLIFILGGGSNILLTQDVAGWVLKNEIRGIEKLSEKGDLVYVRCGAGESWHGLVMHCIEQGWAGTENLSLIPGCAGAAPIQNIGAYGVELKDVFHELEAFDTYTGTVRVFSREECAFGYRDSFFKHAEPGRFIILYITLRLSRQPVFHVEYGAIREELEKAGVTTLSIKAVSDAVIRIRSSKLPDPAVIGNAGSFFKNPTLPEAQFRELRSEYPDVAAYPAGEGLVKVAAGWLIEHCGPSEGISWKGYRVGDAGVHPKQALVLVNYGKATGASIAALASAIQTSVLLKFNIKLDKEVNFF